MDRPPWSAVSIAQSSRRMSSSRRERVSHSQLYPIHSQPAARVLYSEEETLYSYTKALITIPASPALQQARERNLLRPPPRPSSLSLLLSRSTDARASTRQ